MKEAEHAGKQKRLLGRGRVNPDSEAFAAAVGRFATASDIISLTVPA